MKCNPIDVWAASRKIREAACDEALYRAAVSRVYYAAYHRCRLYYNDLPHLSPSGGKGVHEELINRLLNPSSKLTSNGRARSTALGKYLREMCDARVHADYYKPEDEFTEAMMQSAFNSAEVVFEYASVAKGPI